MEFFAILNLVEVAVRQLKEEEEFWGPGIPLVSKGEGIEKREL